MPHHPPYDWEEIQAALDCRVDFKVGRKPTDAPTVCSCGRPMRWIKFASPEWTWRAHCGRAGWVEICEDCQTWERYDGAIMS